jgi:nucleoside 2-deoxyribosyltransferase
VKPLVYLAGFDVFRPDAQRYGEWLKLLCHERGLVGFYPLDGEVPSALGQADAARWIYKANIRAIKSVDIVVANLNDFRGPGEPDSGTAFEVGFATALGKPVFGYRATPEPMIDRVRRQRSPNASEALCERGYLVEDFGLSVNLMLACASTIIVGGVVECLDAVQAAYVSGVLANPGGKSGR